jgi:hypothetical protein
VRSPACVPSWTPPWSASSPAPWRIWARGDGGRVQHAECPPGETPITRPIVAISWVVFSRSLNADPATGSSSFPWQRRPRALLRISRSGRRIRISRRNRRTSACPSVVSPRFPLSRSSCFIRLHSDSLRSRDLAQCKLTTSRILEPTRTASSRNCRGRVGRHRELLSRGQVPLSIRCPRNRGKASSVQVSRHPCRSETESPMSRAV